VECRVSVVFVVCFVSVKIKVLYNEESLAVCSFNCEAIACGKISAENSFGYSDFIRENPATGYLKIQAYRGDQVYPVPNVEVIISRNFDDGERVFFAGTTDENGIIDPIPLPAPPRDNSLSPEKPDKYSEYTLRAQHADYRNINTTVTIYGETKAVQPLQMVLK
jgi:hypothetical protein